MKRENYIITVKSIYIRDAEMFCPESMTEQEILNLDDIDIFHPLLFLPFSSISSAFSASRNFFAESRIASFSATSYSI